MNFLIAEDNDDHAELIQDALEDLNSGHVILRARNGEEALKLTNDEPVDILLLDLKMPRLSGIETLRELKKDPTTRAIPVMILTTSARPDEVHECYSAGAAGYLVKPYTYEELTSMLDRVVAYWSAVKLPN